MYCSRKILGPLIQCMVESHREFAITGKQKSIGWTEAGVIFFFYFLYLRIAMDTRRNVLKQHLIESWSSSFKLVSETSSINLCIQAQASNVRAQCPCLCPWTRAPVARCEARRHSQGALQPDHLTFPSSQHQLMQQAVSHSLSWSCNA